MVPAKLDRATNDSGGFAKIMKKSFGFNPSSNRNAKHIRGVAAPALSLAVGA